MYRERVGWGGGAGGHGLTGPAMGTINPVRLIHFHIHTYPHISHPNINLPASGTNSLSPLYLPVIDSVIYNLTFIPTHCVVKLVHSIRISVGGRSKALHPSTLCALLVSDLRLLYNLNPYSLVPLGVAVSVIFTLLLLCSSIGRSSRAY